MVYIFLVIMTKYLIYFSHPCSSVDRKMRWNIACSLYGHARAQEPLPSGVGGIRIDNFGKPFFGHDDYIISLRDLCLGVEDFLKKCIFTIWLICPRPDTRTCAMGSWNLQYFIRPYLGHHYFTLSMVEEKTIF